MMERSFIVIGDPLVATCDHPTTQVVCCGSGVADKQLADVAGIQPGNIGTGQYFNCGQFGSMVVINKILVQSLTRKPHQCQVHMPSTLHSQDKKF